MKVAYYTDQIYLHGGLERVLANKLNYLSANTNIELHVITFQQNNNKPCYKISEGVKYHDLGINYNREISFLSPKNIKSAPKHYIKLKKKIKQINPDVVVVCNYEFGFYFVPIISKKSINIKEYHSSRHFNFINRRHNNSFFKKIVFKISDYFESKYTYLALLNNDELKYYNSKNKVVIPNALTFFPKDISNQSNKRVISAGRIAPVKGFESLISSWNTINKSCPEWTLDIYGDGDSNYINELKALICKLKLESTVNINKATNSLQEEMVNSSIYAMTSKTECFPMVLLEAMSCGLPVVSFDCPNGPRNIIQNNVDGILVENNNESEFAKKMISLIKNSNIRKEMSKSAFENVKRFDEDIVMPMWLDIFNFSKEN